MNKIEQQTIRLTVRAGAPLAEQILAESIRRGQSINHTMNHIINQVMNPLVFPHSPFHTPECDL